MERYGRGMRLIRCAGLLLGTLGLATGCAPDQLSCDGFEERGITAHILQRKCSFGHVIEITPSALTNSELWVLEEPRATSPNEVDRLMDGALLNDEGFLQRSQAIVQINGFNFQCASAWNSSSCHGADSTEQSIPVSRLYESTYLVSTQKVTASDWLLSFGQRSGAGVPISLIGPDSEPIGQYNAVGSNSPLMQGGVPSDWNNTWPYWNDELSIIGYKTAADDTVEKIFMIYSEKVRQLRTIQDFLVSLGVTDAVLMDGGPSAGIYLNSDEAIDGDKELGSHVRRIPYRLGLVTLDTIPWVTNGGFESPSLPARASGTPTGFHTYAGTPISEQVKWEGAMELYNTPLYNKTRSTNSEYLPEREYQIAAIRPRGLDTNYIAQSLRGVPGNRYCMLRFVHGYYPRAGCKVPNSRLQVKAEPCEGSVGKPTEGEFKSSPTTGSGAHLNEAWLRVLTPEIGNCMRLSFTALDESPLVDSQGVCSVLLDDVSVHCTE